MEDGSGIDFLVSIDSVSNMQITLDEISPYSREDANSSFRLLCRLNMESLWKESEESRFRGTVRDRSNPSPLLVPAKSTLAASGYYHWERRMHCHYRGAVSPVEALASLQSSSTDPSVLRGALRNSPYVACQFNPAIARAVIWELTNGHDARVLDPCAGWGDRLAGAAACKNVVEYIGYDPNTSLEQGYKNQVTDYGKSGLFQIIIQPFEDAQLQPESFDLAFTSPPYFDTEIYSTDPTQSALRYPQLNQWLPGFFKPMLVKAAAAIKPGGYFALNIANVKRRGRMVPLPDFACDIFDNLVGWELKYIWGMTINRKKTCEPIIVWQKTTGDGHVR